MLKLRKNKKGFTLVELIVVIAIMAVLAGVVAGVTVSQLNKQTNKTGQTQAKQVADFIANCAVTNDDADPNDQVLGTDGKFDDTKVENVCKRQYSATSIEVKKSNAAEEGKITVSVATGGVYVQVAYKDKGTGGKTTIYFVTPDGIVSTTNPTASSETEEPVTP